MEMFDGFPFKSGFSGSGWKLENCVAVAAKHPTTFKVPSPDEAMLVQLGDLLRLHFLITDPELRSDPQNPRAERMWVEVCDLPGNGLFRGHLTNMPGFITSLEAGDVIEFMWEHVAQVYVEADNSFKRTQRRGLTPTSGIKSMNIRQHELAWRWTDSQHTVLPEDVLDALHPIDGVETRQFHEIALSCLGNDGFLLSSEFNSKATITEHLSGEAGSDWLTQQYPISETEVVLSWNQTTALKTSWGIFVAYWQDFCYPGSDDLVVFPLTPRSTHNWVLLYHHVEEFHFGRRKADA